MRQLLPHPPLLVPVGDRCDGPQVALTDRVATLGRARQEQHLLLDVRGEKEQVRDLRHAGPHNVAQPGDARVVGDLATTHKILKPDRQRYQPRAGRHRAVGDGRFQRAPSGTSLPPAVLAMQASHEHEGVVAGCARQLGWMAEDYLAGARAGGTVGGGLDVPCELGGDTGMRSKKRPLETATAGRFD